MLVAVALVAGLIGGIGASWVLTTRLAYALPAPQPAKLIQAERVEIGDKDGKVRAVFGLGEDGEPMLRLFDKEGTGNTLLLPLALALVGPDGKPRLVLRLQTGEPYLGLIDTGQKLRAVLGLNNGEPTLRLADKDRRVIWKAP
jgi:hypothetical protein